jgi:AcrR family transcriptional regulator
MSRKEQAAASRARLVEAARHCFTEYGYEATTVAAVLERAGMARGALYHYFPRGKQELFAAVFDSINQAFHRRRDALLKLDSPLARIRAGIRVFLELCIEDDFARIALVDAPSHVPGQAQRGSSYELLRTQLDAAAAAGEVRNVHPEAMAIVLYGAVRSAGEFVRAASDRRRAVADAVESFNQLLTGLTAGAGADGKPAEA